MSLVTIAEVMSGGSLVTPSGIVDVETAVAVESHLWGLDVPATSQQSASAEVELVGEPAPLEVASEPELVTA